MAALARQAGRPWQRPRWLARLADGMWQAHMNGDVHGYIAGGLALLIVAGVIALYIVRGAVPDVLNYSLLAVIGFFFAKGTTPPPPADPPAAPSRPQIVVPNRADGAGGNHAAG